MSILFLFIALGFMLSLSVAGDRHNFTGDITVAAAGGGYTRGTTYLLNSGAYAVARETAAAGQPCLMAIINDQPVEGTKATGASTGVSVGSKVYVTAAGLLTAVPTSNTLVGVAVEVAGDSATTLKVINSGLAPTAT